MKTEIYYFSGTGNSLAVARDIAEKTSGKLIPIPSVMDQPSIQTDADVIGIIFPVYFRAVLGGIPLIVRRFAGKLEDIGSKYIFAVCTYGMGQPNFSILRNAVQSRGGKLAAGFAVKMPFPYLSLSGLGAIEIEQQQKMFGAWKKKLEDVYETVATQKYIEVNSGNVLTNTFLVPLGKLYYYLQLRKLPPAPLPVSELLLWMDSYFRLTGQCNGCGICSRICPVSNIEMVDDKPAWQHRCEQCCACVQWCPKEAILFNGKTVNGKRFHHPDVKISDLLRQH